MCNPKILEALHQCNKPDAQARLAKAALRDALARLKRARPLALRSAFERRIACLGALAQALAGVVRRGSFDTQERACGALQCGLPELADAVQARGGSAVLVLP